ncbi:MAG: two-component system response regulator [Kofleriaceae bacterium]
MGATNGDKPVLIVEDDLGFRTALEELFSDEGYKVATAANGVEAIEWLQHHAPCAIVLDLLMPGVVGQELLEHMQSDQDLSKIPVVVVSGSPDLAPKGYKVFRKPIDGTELLDFVRSSVPRSPVSVP